MAKGKIKKLLGIILFLVIASQILDWLRWREPEWETSYDSSLLSKDEVLDIAEQLVVYQFEQEIRINGVNQDQAGYHLHLFNGQLDSDFFERFRGRGFPAINGNYAYNGTQRTIINILRFEHQDKNSLTVIFDREFVNWKKETFEAVFVKKGLQWHYL